MIDWTSENILPKLQELVKNFMIYQATKNSIGVFFGVVFLIIGIILIIKPTKAFITAANKKETNAFWKYYTQLIRDDINIKGIGMAYYIIGSIFFICGLPIFIANLIYLIKDIYVPELVLIEYINTFKGMI